MAAVNITRRRPRRGEMLFRRKRNDAASNIDAPRHQACSAFMQEPCAAHHRRDAMMPRLRGERASFLSRAMRTNRIMAIGVLCRTPMAIGSLRHCHDARHIDDRYAASSCIR